MIDEKVLIVFDPLAERQTTQIQHIFRGAIEPFVLVMPIPVSAEVRIGHRRAFASIFRLIHPVSDAGRSISVQLKSWLVNCFAPLAGDPVTLDQETPHVASKVLDEHTLPTASSSRQLFLDKGVQIAPAHVEWMRRYREDDWSFVAFTVRPTEELAPGQTLAGPVMTITHDATHISHSIYRPSSQLLSVDGEPRPPVEVAILTEWPVGVEGHVDLELEMSDSVGAAQLRRLEKKSNGVPWGFRRDGHLTVYRLDDRTRTPILRFWKDESIPPKKPTPTRREKPVIFEIPIELAVLTLLAFMRARRGRGQWKFQRQNDQRLR